MWGADAFVFAAAQGTGSGRKITGALSEREDRTLIPGRVQVREVQEGTSSSSRIIINNPNTKPRGRHSRRSSTSKPTLTLSTRPRSLLRSGCAASFQVIAAID